MHQEVHTEKPISIGALARASGVPVETIRYYERIGLLAKPQRSASGYRVYRADDARRIGFIRRARELGFSLADVQALLSLAVQPGATCGEARELAAGHLADVRRKLHDLKAMQRVLDEMIRRCERGESPDCPIIHALSYASGLGKPVEKLPARIRPRKAAPARRLSKNINKIK